MVDKNSFDCAATDLLCDEGSKGLCFDDDDDDGGLFEPFNDQSHHQSNGEKEVIFSNGGPDSEALMYLPCLSEECICWMVERERVHLPRDDYLSRLRSGELDIRLRRKALDWMFKACAHYNFGELCLCSAMSYVDRFLSVYELPVDSLERGDKRWAIQLVAVACLSLAAKIEEVNVPSTVDLQGGETKFLFEGKTIQRMESAEAYTPCNFIDYYLRKTNDNEFPSGPLITRSLQIILSTLEGIEFLEFRPSEIAAAVAMYVSGEIQATDIDDAVSRCVGVEKERVVKCIELIQELKSTRGISTTTTTNVGNGSVSSTSEPQSPNGVLEAACLSYKSDEGTVESCPSSSHTSPDTKRRKLDQTATVGGES
ncbi:cyclin-D4-1-like [Sesamum indicum]|uniref:Cyclin-D4-1-like n=1 Tax=Sesamum indicum TaxID=4182 RepID=A0A6I9ULJ2_SESIN|nr:cyclin-D4-1-like [Sesamum indicum]